MENETRILIKTLEDDISYSLAEIKSKTEESKLKTQERDNLKEKINEVNFITI
jgi:hypothetical protein